MRSNLVKLLKDNHSISLLTNVSVAFFGFVTFLILVRTYTTESFGLWVLYLAPLTFAEMIKSGLVKTSMVRYLSGASDVEKKQIIGASWILSVTITSIIVVLMLSALLIFPHVLKNSSYHFFFIYYPFYAYLSLPMTNALGILESGQKFAQIFILRFLSTSLFLVFVIINTFLPLKNISTVIIVHFIINAVISIVSILKGWSGIGYLKKATREKFTCLLNYGKYSVGTMLGSNLLRSSDTIIIGLSPLGPSAVALYSVPLKLIEIMDIPLRSLVINAFPKMSRASIMGDNNQVKRLFYQYSGGTTLFFVPGLIICVIFAKFLILLIGGDQYVESETAIVLFQIFAVYSLLLPIDRFSGITLDSIAKPNLNLFKVLIMAALNIVGDLIAVFVFNSLIGVALVTVIFTMVGQIIGYNFLRKELNIEYRLIFYLGFEFFVTRIKEFFKTTKPGVE